MTEPGIDLKHLTADIVGAHVANNNVTVGDLPALISSVYGALSGLGQEPAPAPAEKPTPAVPVRSSVKPDYIICLEDGARLKMMKRYLATRYNMTPDEYRRKWGLPHDYPMTALNHSQSRSALSEAAGFGRKAAAKVEETVQATAKPVRARAKKIAEAVEEAVTPAAPARRGPKPKQA